MTEVIWINFSKEKKLFLHYDKRACKQKNLLKADEECIQKLYISIKTDS